jgi:hypothetical protein
LDRYEDFLKEWILVGHKSDWKPNVYGQVKSWIDGGLEPRAVTRDLDWELMFLWLEPKEKNYMFGLMRLSDIFPLPKNGPREKVKNGNHIGRSRHKAGSLYWERQYRFSLCDFPCDVKS